MKILRIASVALFLLIGAATFWVNRTIDEANGIKDQAGIFLNTGNEQTQAAAEKVAAIEAKAFPGDRTEIAALAAEAVDLLKKSSVNFREAGDKLKQASEVAAEPVVKEYYELESQHLLKLAEVKELFGQRTANYLDESIADAEQLNAKLAAVDEQLAKAMAEESVLEKKSIDFAGAHKDKITFE